MNLAVSLPLFGVQDCILGDGRDIKCWEEAAWEKKFKIPLFFFFGVKCDLLRYNCLGDILMILSQLVC